jgi:hypothetical protein
MPSHLWCRVRPLFSVPSAETFRTRCCLLGKPEGAGDRYFDDSVRGSSGICSRFLLVFDSDADALARKVAKQLSESFRDIVEASPRHNPRPAGWLYIVYSADSRDAIGALTRVRSPRESNKLARAEVVPA